MFIPVELVLKSYMPKQLEVGMWFITKANQDTLKEYVEVWALDKVPFEPIEEFITTHGAPVEPYIIYDEQVIAEPHEIGWWDDGPESDDLRDISLKEVNFILVELDGEVDIEVDDDSLFENEEINPILYNDKVTLCIPGIYEEEDDDEEDQGPWLCEACNGSGYGATPDVACSVCHGDGEICPEEEEDDTDMDDDDDDEGPEYDSAGYTHEDN